MIKLYNKELSLSIISKYIYEYFKSSGVNIVYTDKINKQDDELYLILGGEYLIDIPKRYGIFQLLPTSNLTIKQNIEAYWIDKDYLSLLQKSEFILDLSKENIRVWQEFYQLDNVFHFDWNFQSCLLLSKREFYIPDKSSIFLLGEKRSKKINKDKKYELLCENNWSEIVTLIQNKKGIAVILSDYENTYQNLPLISYLRYNNIPCIVEKGRDNLINEKCNILGCKIWPYIRIEKNISSIINSLEINEIKLSKKIIPSLPEMFLSQLPLKNEQKKNKNKLNLFDRKTISSVEFDILEDGGISLKLSGISDDILPKITILTPTFNRRWIFPLAIRNFLEFNYPKDKIEWIIIDDSENSIEEIIPNDNRIRYYYLNKKLTIGEKRNKLVELSNTDIVLFMDDDDYYPPESLLARVKSLIKYKEEGIECVGCIDVASYDLKNDNCAICSNGKSYFCESSLAFYKKFWLERKFCKKDSVGEFRKFLEYRQNKVKNLPFQFVTIAFAHGKNTTGNVRTLNKSLKETSEIKQLFDEDLLEFIKRLKKNL